jgi:hypothetical protein
MRMASRARLVPPLLGGLVVALLAAGIAAAAVGAGGGGGSSDNATAPGTPSASPMLPSASPTSTSSSSASPTATLSGPVAALAATLLDPPAGFHRVPDSAGGTGPLDLAAAAKVDGGGALSKVGLRRLGFERGISREWQSGKDVLVVLAYQFGNAKGASTYVKVAARVRSHDNSYTKAPAPAKVPHVAAFRQASGVNTTDVVLFPAGSRAYVLGLVHPPNAPKTDTVKLLTHLQYAAARS